MNVDCGRKGVNYLVLFLLGIHAIFVRIYKKQVLSAASTGILYNLLLCEPFKKIFLRIYRFNLNILSGNRQNLKHRQRERELQNNEIKCLLCTTVNATFESCFTLKVFQDV